MHLLLHPSQYGPWNLPRGLLCIKPPLDACITAYPLHWAMGKWEGVGPWKSQDRINLRCINSYFLTNSTWTGPWMLIHRWKLTIKECPFKYSLTALLRGQSAWGRNHVLVHVISYNILRVSARTANQEGVKGTVRPDWINLNVVHFDRPVSSKELFQPLYFIYFCISWL